MRSCLSLGIAAAASLALATAAAAKVPCPSCCSVPTHLCVAGMTAGIPDTTLGAFGVVLRDLANNPENHDDVWVDVTGCPDCRMPAAGAVPGVPVQCPDSYGVWYTDLQGTAQLVLVGGSTGAPGTPGPSVARIFAAGVLIAEVRIAIYDLDGRGGLTANDLSLWLTDYGTQQYIGRDDYDGDGKLGANDLSLWLTALGRGTSTASVTSFCP